MRLAIRVAASARIGIGHVKRCLALASAWRAHGLGEIRFVTRNGDGARLIGEAGHDLALLPAAEEVGVDQVLDAEQTLAALGQWHPGVVLVDHYGLGARWHEAVRQGIGARLAAIDDLADRPMAVDLLVDHNLAEDHRAKYGRQLPASARLLGGTRFALIDPLFASAPKASPRDMVQSIGIFMGGADAAGATPHVLEACRARAGFAGPIEVVSTSANPALEGLRAACARWPQTMLTLDLDHLGAFYARHDLQIGAGGGASWERCCIGAPTLALVCADNQAEVVAELVRRGAVASAPSLEPAAIGAALSALLADAATRRRLLERAGDLVDGRGAERVALALAVQSLTLRVANEADAALAYNWRNDERTRQYFHDPAPLTFDMHKSWWRRAVTEPTRNLLIARCGQRDVGVVRLDITLPTAKVSIYVDPHLTGIGLGTAMLNASKRWSVTEGGIERLTASIRAENAASQSAFLAAGFIQRDLMHWECELVR